MAQQTISWSGKKHAFLWSAIVILLIGGLSSLALFWGRTMGAVPQSAVSQSLIHQNGCASVSSRWTPVGVRWKLTVTFVNGKRQGEIEPSIMVFLPDGTLTATFPGPTPDSPPAQPPAIDGSWCMVGQNAFAYQFREPLYQGKRLVAYVQVHINAQLTSPTTYVGGGVGMVYQAGTDAPIPLQGGVTTTVAVKA